MAENNKPTNPTPMTSADAAELLKRMKAIASDLWREPVDTEVSAEPKAPQERPAKVVVKQPDIRINNLWMTADETVDWTDAMAHDVPADGLTSPILWRFYHEKAEKVLSGDLKTYAEVLKKANPLGELTAFAGSISMRAPDPDRLEAQFVCHADYLESDGRKYLCAMGVRIARDLFAILPVSEVAVTATAGSRQAMQVTYRRQQLLHRNFSFLDPVAFTEESGAQFD